MPRKDLLRSDADTRHQTSSRSRLKQVSNHITRVSRTMATSQGDMPLAGAAKDGYNKDGRATATCFCGAVQIEVVSTGATVVVHNVQSTDLA